MGRGPSFDYSAIRALAGTMSKDAIAKQIGCSLGTVNKVVGKTGRGVGRGAARGMKTAARFKHGGLDGKSARMPPYDHPALMEGRTTYPTTVIHPSVAGRLLKEGINASKIGSKIRKGRWAGMPVYTLTLEERATCPRSCRHWRSCYGGNMHFAERLMHGDALTARLEREITVLSTRHRGGFAIRLHVLGDFYSTAYVAFWARMLQEHAGLRVFGFTARIDFERDPIARRLADLVEANWARFAIRFSNADLPGCSTASIEHPYQKPDDAIICPAQLGQSESCSTCALCWGTTKRIAFITH